MRAHEGFRFKPGFHPGVSLRVFPGAELLGQMYVTGFLLGYDQSIHVSELLVFGRPMDGAPPTGWERLSTPQ